MRIIVTARGWRLIDLDIMSRVPSHREPASAASHAGPDPHSTISAQVEQASEPAPGFGFTGHVGTVVARDGGGG